MQYNYTNRINTPAHQELALSAAQQGIVLLENDDDVLPLSGKPSIAVIGPNGDATRTMQGNYYGNAPYLISPVMGLNNYSTATYSQGCDVKCSSTSGFAAAKTLAGKSDVAVVVVGIDESVESEGHDRYQITLPGNQNELVTEIAGVAKKTIVVVMGGGSLDLTEIKGNDKVDAILWCGYPGQSGGQALADVIFGKINPGGRMPYTIFPAVYGEARAHCAAAARSALTRRRRARSERVCTHRRGDAPERDQRQPRADVPFLHG